MNMLMNGGGMGGFSGLNGFGGGRRRRRRRRRRRKPSIVIHTHRYVNPMYGGMGGMGYGMGGMPMTGMMYGRRRMMEDQNSDNDDNNNDDDDHYSYMIAKEDVIDYAENMELGVGVEKCALVEERREICIRYDYVDGNVTMKERMYTDKMEMTGKRVKEEVSEWILRGIDVGDEQIYECNDNFDDLEEICVEKWRLYDDDVQVVVKSVQVEGGEKGFSLMDDAKWNNVYHVNGQSKTLCQHIMDETMLCVELDIEPETK